MIDYVVGMGAGAVTTALAFFGSDGHWGRFWLVAAVGTPVALALGWFFA